MSKDTTAGGGTVNLFGYWTTWSTCWVTVRSTTTSSISVKGVGECQSTEPTKHNVLEIHNTTQHNTGALVSSVGVVIDHDCHWKHHHEQNSSNSHLPSCGRARERVKQSTDTYGGRHVPNFKNKTKNKALTDLPNTNYLFSNTWIQSKQAEVHRYRRGSSWRRCRKPSGRTSGRGSTESSPPQSWPRPL